MRFVETALAGVWILEIEPHTDERGFFARVFDAEELAARGCARIFLQCSISYNEKRGTLRGLHYQATPHEEDKLVRCTRGAVYDVVVDLRRGSPTFKRWLAVELSARNHRALYVPRGVAHGFQTLEDETELYYAITPEYRPEAARGVRWDDPAFAVEWPTAEPRIMSDRDRRFADFEP